MTVAVAVVVEEEEEEEEEEVEEGGEGQVQQTGESRRLVLGRGLSG
jgi:hypothetical protein